MNTGGGNVLTHLTLKIIKSTQYKKLAQNASQVGYILKFEILQNTWKNKTESIKMLELLVKNWKLKSLMFFVSFFSCDCKISNWRKLFVLSWLYQPPYQNFKCMALHFLPIFQCVTRVATRGNQQKILKIQKKNVVPCIQIVYLVHTYFSTSIYKLE